MCNVIFEKKDHTAVITLNKTNVLNALSASFIKEIDAALTQAESDPDVYVLIITGAGKAFVAGADITEMLPLTGAESLVWTKAGLDLFSRIENLRIPVIAAVNGFALGGGCEMAMACDIRIASEKAKFGQPETGLGITPGFGGTQRLPRIVGMGRAKELIYTAKMITAQEAYEIGLVNKVVAPEALMDEALALAAQICANAQIAVQQAKRAINKGMQTDIETGLAYELQAFSLCHTTEDKKIGMEAFISRSKEKHFTGR